MQERKIAKYALKQLRSFRTPIYLSLILLTALYFRVYNINWDNSFYFHPDERAIVMSALPLHLPKDIGEFFSQNSPLNPHFFAYGNFPIYLLKIGGVLFSRLNPLYNQYGGIHIIGRLISAFFDTATVLVIFLIGLKVLSKRAGLIAALLYALSVFPIQLSHYYAVDSLLTFFMTSTILGLISFSSKPQIRNAIFIGIMLGFSLSTKISALILTPYVILVFLYLFFDKHRKRSISLTKLAISGFVLVAFAIGIFVITQPYAVLDFSEFFLQTTLQTRMSHDPFIFPYTLQYVGKIPYIYELRNIFFWGMGPVITTICLVGLVVFIYQYYRHKPRKYEHALILLYFFGYFALFGSFAVGWMRYMLPIYPMLAIFGGFLVAERVIPKIPKAYIKLYPARKGLLILFCAAIVIYPISYQSIYTKINTRLMASNWINKNIPFGSTLAVEHWDDSLPVYGQENYIQITLPLYEPDTTQKWQNMDQLLLKSEYIIIASNRLYAPLQKLTDCKKLPKFRCYPTTAKYYKSLFSGGLGYRKVAEFSSYPTLPFIQIPLIDDTADESFTVIDHPKIMIYKRTENQNKNHLPIEKD